MSDFLYLTERDVTALLDPRAVIRSLTGMLREQAREEARNVPKALATWGDGGSMHALGSLMPGRGYLGFKTWAHTKEGGAAMFTLFDSRTGNLLAVIEARTLGQLRTSGIAGVATDLMSSASADSMTLVGTGAQAMLQIAAVAAVRPLRSATVFSPTPEKRRAFVERARKLFPFEIREADSVASAVDGAPIVTIITRAREPFLRAAHLAPRAHLNAVGAILPMSAEFDQDVFGVTRAVVVDDMENARRGSRELRERFGTGEGGWDEVRTLAQLAAGVTKLPDGEGITVFKGMGMGLSDLALAAAVYEGAKANDAGAKIKSPERFDALAVWSEAGKIGDRK
ncbi:ornithine cyclodeaminase family protein [Ramlibacter sp.]|uniref:ornithine cyclodeaminase family protein n=1 Tax=Ramlibacter sp. TaxID=1917967 RepID=UPI003D09AE4C